LHQSERWRSYTSHPLFQKYGRVYVHSKHAVTDPFLLESAKIVEDPVVHTMWGHISIVEATLRLMTCALQDNDDNSYFMLLSESCIPVQDFGSFYSFLETQTSPLSIFNGSQCPCGFYYRYKDVRHLEDGSPYLPWEQFMVQSQWMLLSQEDLRFLVEKRGDTQYFQYMCVPDEHYFINVLRRHQRPVMLRELTRTQWTSGSSHPDTFSHITPDLIRFVVSGGAFFLRKVDSNTEITHNL